METADVPFDWPLSYADKPIHSEILRDDARFKVLVAGRRGGKTSLIRTDAMMESLRDPGLRWYVTPTLEQGRDEFYSKLIADCSGTGLIVDTNDTRLEIRWCTGAITQCKSVKDAKHKRGRGLKKVYADEFQDWPWNAWESVVRPMLADHQAPAWIAGTVNGYGTQFHDFFRRGMRGDAMHKPGWRSWLWTAYEAGTIASDEIDSARADAESAGPIGMKQFRREWLADWSAFVGQVFEEWDPTRMIVPRPRLDPDGHGSLRTSLEASLGVRFERVMACADWGFSSEHFGVLQVWGRDARGCWWMLDEVAHPGQAWSFWTQKFVTLWMRWGFEVIWLPDDQPGGIRECQLAAIDEHTRSRRWGVREVQRVGTSNQRVHAIGELMHTDRFRIVGRGTRLESEIPAYHWERTAGGVAKEKPEKFYDDAIDCAGHGLYSEAERRLPFGRKAA